MAFVKPHVALPLIPLAWYLGGWRRAAGLVAVVAALTLVGATLAGGSPLFLRDYLAFLPGELVGVRAGWPKGSDPTLESLDARARVTTNAAARQAIYRRIQLRLNQVGPFVPLIQPTQVFVSTTDLRNAVFNPVYQVDVTQVRAK